MARKTRFAIGTALFLAWLFTSAVALQLGREVGFEEGGQIGFLLGSERQRQKEAVYQGVQALETLERLPDSADAGLRAALEQTIDGALVNYLSFVEGGDSAFDLFRVPLCADPAVLAAHRATTPSGSEDAGLRERIDAAVSFIRSTPTASVSHGCGGASSA